MLELPSSVKVKDYHGEGVYVEKDPLLYSYQVPTLQEAITGIEKTTEDFPAYNLYPNGPWNYALDVNRAEGFAVQFSEKEGNELSPWTKEGCPYQIQVPARKVIGWELEKADKIKAVYNLYVVPWVEVEEEGEFLLHHVSLIRNL